MLSSDMSNWDWFRLIENLKVFKGLFCPSLYFGAAAAFLFLLLVFSPVPTEEQGGISPVFISVLQEREEPFLAASLSVRESPDLTFVQKNSLVAVSPPVSVTPQVLGALSGVEDYQEISRDIIEYTVESGDTLSSIAERFNISENTVRWANEMSDSTVRPGQQLSILPASGALHVVRRNDTLSEIAGWYRADMEDIMVFNELASVEQIFAGDLLIIPNGTKPVTLPHARLAFQGKLYPPTGYPYRITQGLHHFNAIDFGAPCGSPVYAAESGVVQMTGFHSIGGNFVRIEHPNGIITYYGHLAPGGILVSRGQQVNRGDRIGLVGMTGLATGCHVHFEVRGAANPFAR